jgi:hypothetical protein
LKKSICDGSFTPESGHREADLAQQLGANSGLQQLARYLMGRLAKASQTAFAAPVMAFFRVAIHNAL